MRYLIFILLLLVGCKSKQKVTEREKIKENTKIVEAIKVDRIKEKDSTAKIVTIKENDIVEIEVDSGKVVTKEVVGNKTIITGAKKITFKKEKEEKKEKVEVNEKEKTNIDQKKEEQTTKKHTKRTSDVDIKGGLGWLWWLLLIVPIYLIWRNRKSIRRIIVGI